MIEDKPQPFQTRFVTDRLFMLTRLWMKPTGSWNRVAPISPKT